LQWRPSQAKLWLCLVAFFKFCYLCSEHLNYVRSLLWSICREQFAICLCYQTTNG
jgi:uncharacterized MAPEG superfamily protein